MLKEADDFLSQHILVLVHSSELVELFAFDVPGEDGSGRGGRNRKLPKR